MRVLMLHANYTAVGGELFSVTAETDGLRLAGAEVLVAGIQNADMEARGTASSIWGSLGPGKNERLGAILAEFKPDLVHCQNLFPYLGPRVITTLRRAGVPWIRTLRNYRLRCLSANLWREGHDCLRCTSADRALPGVRYGCYRDSRILSLGALAYARRERQSGRGYPPDAYIAVSEFVRGRLSETLDPSVPCYVKPNSVESPALAPSERSGVLFVGRLTPEKGYRTALRLAEADAALPVRVIGDGSGADELARAERQFPNLTWTRNAPHDNVMTSMAAARLVIVPSEWDEPFGRVAIEALSVGTPSLVAARGGLPEIVKGLSPDLIVPNDHQTGWVTSVARLLADKPRLAELAAEAKNHHAAYFSPQATTRQLIGIYESVLDSTRRGM
jgi:glycosyltransferase involved in cell wall biosynthesis